MVFRLAILSSILGAIGTHAFAPLAHPQLGLSHCNVEQQRTSSSASSLGVGTDSVLAEVEEATLKVSSWFPRSEVYDNEGDANMTLEQRKAQILQLGAALDRGQSYNPTSGEYYSGTMLVAKKKIQELIDASDPNIHIPKTLYDIEGEWELVLTTVKHGIFRSSPFFLAVQEAFGYAENSGTSHSTITLLLLLLSFHPRIILFPNLMKLYQRCDEI